MAESSSGHASVFDSTNEMIDDGDSASEVFLDAEEASDGESVPEESFVDAEMPVDDAVEETAEGNYSSVLSDEDRAWEENFQRLQEYGAANGDLLVPFDYKDSDGAKLGAWANLQRKHYFESKGKRSSAETSRFDRLQQIGFEWKPRARRGRSTRAPVTYNESVALKVCAAPVSSKGSAAMVSPVKVSAEKWDTMFAHLKNYEREWGHTNVPSSFIADGHVKLGEWVENQRKAHLSKRRYRSLHKIGFWKEKTGTSRKNDEKWDQMFHRLVVYKEKNGSLQMPYRYVDEEGFNLGVWVNNQRLRYRTTTVGTSYQNYTPLEPAQIERLNQIGFRWKMSYAKDEATWYQMYELLKAYKEEHGNTCMAVKYKVGELRLGGWVQDQRAHCRRLEETGRCELDERRLKLLERIGLDWERKKPKPVGPVNKNERWNKKFQSLLAFKKKYGHVKVPVKYVDPEGLSLGNWVFYQRMRYWKTKEGKGPPLRPDRIRRLNDVGFCWQLSPGDRYRCDERGFCWKVGGTKDDDSDDERDDDKGSESEKVSPGDSYRIQVEGGNDEVDSDDECDDDMGSESEWDSMYGLLKAYHKKHGNTRVPLSNSVDKSKLGVWVESQRRDYRDLVETGRSLLDRRQVELLDAVGLDWERVEVRTRKSEKRKGSTKSLLKVSVVCDPGEPESPRKRGRQDSTLKSRKVSTSSASSVATGKTKPVFSQDNLSQPKSEGNDVDDDEDLVWF